MKGVILAAGVGSRLAPYTDIIPKALMPIALDHEHKFRSIIEQIIYQMALAGIDNIIIVVNHKAETIKSYLGDGKHLGVRLTYVLQDVLDGNGGAFYRTGSLLQPGEQVFLTDCVNFLSNDLCIKEFVSFHNTGAFDLSVGTFPVEQIEKYAVIRTDGQGNPLEIFEKPKDKSYWGNLAKSGMMILGKALSASDKSISRTPAGEYTPTMIISYALSNGLKVGLYPISCEFTDIGTWSDYIRILKGQLNL
jgi:NDP-sugar pyrophosphorylase family protein